MNLLNLQNVNFSYDDFKLSNIDFSLESGNTLGLFGPSGSGKSTILKLIAGLAQPSSGDILLNNNSIITVSPELRKIGMIFQTHALFPHLNVFENIAFGLKMKKMDKNQIFDEVTELLDLLNISHLKSRHVSELSTGESQRVAIARSLAPRPKLLLMDEPFSSLDNSLKISLRAEISNIFHNLGISAIIVSHDILDIVPFTSNILFIDNGIIVDKRNLQDIYSNPISTASAKMLGFISLNTIFAMQYTFNNFKEVFLNNNPKLHDFSEINICAHPEIMTASDDKIKNSIALKCVVVKSFYPGPNLFVTLKIIDSQEIIATNVRWVSKKVPYNGQHVFLCLLKEDLKII